MIFLLVYLVGFLSSIFISLFIFALILTFTTSLRTTWRKRRIQRTTLPAGRLDATKFPKNLFDKPWESLTSLPKPTFTKKQLNDYLKIAEEAKAKKKGENRDEDTVPITHVGDIEIQSGTIWLPRFALLSSTGYLSLLNFSPDKETDAQDCTLLGQIKLQGCAVSLSPSDPLKRTFTLTHTSQQSIFCVSEDEDLSADVLSDALHFGVASSVCVRVSDERECTLWMERLGDVIKKLPPWGYEKEPKFPYFRKGVPVYDVSFLGAFLNRVFADIQTSELFQADIHKTIKKKIDDLNLPSFVGPIIVDKIDPGSSFIELERACVQQTEGTHEFILQAFGKYKGGAGADISTELIFGKNLGISIDISVRLKSLEGVINIYAPPTLGDLWSLYLIKPPNPDTFEADVSIKLGGINLCRIPLLKKFLNSCVYRAIGFVLTWPGRVTICFPFPGRKFDPEPEPYDPKKKIKRIGHRRQRPSDSETTVDIEKKFVMGRLFNEVLFRKQIDSIDEIYTDSATISGFVPFFYEKTWEIIGRDAMKKAVGHLCDAFSEIYFYIVDMGVPRVGFGNPNFVHLRFRMRGKHDSQPLWNIPPSGHHIVFEGIVLTEFQIIDEKFFISDQIWYWAPQGLLSSIPDLEFNPIREKIDEFDGAVVDDDFLRSNAAQSLASTST